MESSKSHGTSKGDEVKPERSSRSTAAARGRDAVAAMTSRLETLNLAVDVTVTVTEKEELPESQLRGSSQHRKEAREEQKKAADGYVKKPPGLSLDGESATTVGSGPWDQHVFSQPPRGADASAFSSAAPVMSDQCSGDDRQESLDCVWTTIYDS